MAKPPLIALTESGLYCAAGDFYIDPWRAVNCALVTHAHGDHAYSGSAQYWGAGPGLPLLKQRLASESVISTLPYGKGMVLGDTEVSFHPAGHILGSAQVRVSDGEETWVVSGDYKRAFDPTCASFEVVPCDTFITEATFGLPIYRWEPGAVVAEEILRWWNRNRDTGKTSILFCYALGKAQRVLAELARLTDRVVLVHGAMESLTHLYRQAGIPMLPTQLVSEIPRMQSLAGELVLAPPSGFRSPWMKRFKDFETGFASGWMRVRGGRRRRGYDRGFVVSDHADWPELLQTIKETGARRILPTHGNTDTLVRYLMTQGYDAIPLKTHYGAEEED